MLLEVVLKRTGGFFQNFFDFNSMCLLLQYILMSHNSKKCVLLTNKSFTKVIRKALHVSFQFSRDGSEKEMHSHHQTYLKVQSLEILGYFMLKIPKSIKN